ncbi:MAG TPA: carbohydrate kinase family protein, partial [Aggregatilineales bacterium]|nr:carbohydrate kinase family protein [Aggregatilineales bacterium]
RLKTLVLDAGAWANMAYWQPAFQVEVAGTTGAGDAAYAGFLCALLNGATPDAALRLASAVGACCVEAVDATSGIRSREDIRTRLGAGWPIRLDRLAGYGSD